MKFLIAICGSLLLCTTSHASYNCVASSGEKARLEVTNYKQIKWYSLNDDAYSEGQLVGQEDAAFSPRKGEYKFQLKDHFKTDSQGYILSIPVLPTQFQEQIQVTEVLDNDDHDEQEVVYQCRLNALKCVDVKTNKTGQLEINSDGTVRGDFEDAADIVFTDAVKMQKKGNLNVIEYNDDGYGGIYNGYLKIGKAATQITFQTKTCSELGCHGVKRNSFVCK